MDTVKSGDQITIDFELDRETYRPQLVTVMAITANWNKIYRDVYIYILRGYKPQGMDFSIMITDLLQQPWRFWPGNDKWYWGLTAKQRFVASYERAIVVNTNCWDQVEIQACEHGPGFSEEFEKSFDNMIV